MYVDTKQMIARQLFEMLRHKKLEDVTIKALVDACQALDTIIEKLEEPHAAM